jgi:hypothetical protein
MRRHFRVLDGGMSKEQTQAILNARISPGETFQSMTIRETNYAFPVMVYHSVLSYRKNGKTFYNHPVSLKNFSFLETEPNSFQVRYNITNDVTKNDDLFIVELIVNREHTFSVADLWQVFTFLYNGFFMNEKEIEKFKERFVENAA